MVTAVAALTTVSSADECWIISDGNVDVHSDFPIGVWIIKIFERKNNRSLPIRRHLHIQVAQNESCIL